MFNAHLKPQRAWSESEERCNIFPSGPKFCLCLTRWILGPDYGRLAADEYSHVAQNVQVPGFAGRAAKISFKSFATSYLVPSCITASSEILLSHPTLGLRLGKIDSCTEKVRLRMSQYRRDRCRITGNILICQQFKTNKLSYLDTVKAWEKREQIRESVFELEKECQKLENLIHFENLTATMQQ